MVEMRRKFERPCEAEEEVQEDSDVIELVCGEIEAGSKGVRGGFP